MGRTSTSGPVWLSVATLLKGVFITMAITGMGASGAMAASTGYFAPGTAASKGAANIILIYTGYYGSGAGDWDLASALPYVAYGVPKVDENGRWLLQMDWKDWFFDTYLFLGLQAPSGRAFDSPARSAPARQEDWQWYIDHLFVPDMQLDAFDQAVALSKERGLGPADYRGKVIIMIPNPIATQQDFGDVDGDGISENFSTVGQTSAQATAARTKAVQWYIHQVLTRWQEKQYKNLELIGFYWVEEEVHMGVSTEASTLQTIHDQLADDGYLLFWIPWYSAPGVQSWQRWGFDVVIHQPNYMFNRKVPKSRLEQAAALSRAKGMGVEIEADSSILTDPEGRERYLDYLRAGVQFGYMTEAIKAYYQDARALLDAFSSQDPEVRRMYDATYDFVKGRFNG